jgi:integrase
VAGSGAGTLSASSASWTRRGTSPAISPKLTTAAPGGRAARASRRSRDRAALADRHAPLRRLPYKGHRRLAADPDRQGAGQRRRRPHPGQGPRSIEFLVAKYLAAAGIHGASVHTLRHPFGTPSAPTRSSRCTKLRVAREVLGHSSLETTSIYVGLAGKTWTGREDMDRQLQEMRYRPVQRFSTAMCTDGSLVRDG